MLRTILLITTLFTVSGVFASNFNFIHKSAPISDFNKNDMAMFETAIQTALNEKKDGQKLAWKNEKSGSSGLVNPLSTYIDDKSECRDVRIVNKSKKNIAESKFRFCKKDGTWLVTEMLK